MDQELLLSQKQEYEDRKEFLKNAMNILNDREKEILKARRLNENPKTLDELSKKFKISRERIRQIETKAFEKLQKSMINASKSKNLLPKKLINLKKGFQLKWYLFSLGLWKYLQLWFL